MTGRIEPNTIYSSADVARLVFARSVPWFYKYRNGAGRQEGFPTPTSPNGHPRWLGARLLAWLANPRRPASPEALVADLTAGNVVDINATLRARSLAVATAGRRRLSH